MASKKEYKEKFIQTLKAMKTYRVEFDYTIEVLSSICELRDMNLKEWKKDHYRMAVPYTNKAGAENLSKSPYFLNNLQFNEQILKYVKSLGLTPADANRLGIELSETGDDIDAYIM